MSIHVFPEKATQQTDKEVLGLKCLQNCYAGKGLGNSYLEKFNMYHLNNRFQESGGKYCIKSIKTWCSSHSETSATSNVITNTKGN